MRLIFVIVFVIFDPLGSPLGWALLVSSSGHRIMMIIIRRIMLVILFLTLCQCHSVRAGGAR
jgi:hypothetical protein